MCEVLKSELDDGRDKPIIIAPKFIREYLMKKIANMEKVIMKWKGPLTPYGTKLMVIKIELSKVQCCVYFSFA